MSRRCELTGKGPMTGNNVSHANNRTRRRFLPNLNHVTLQSEILGRSVKLRISAAALRTVDHRGGLDAFLAKAKDFELSANALKVKKRNSKIPRGLTKTPEIIVSCLGHKSGLISENKIIFYGPFIFLYIIVKSERWTNYGF